MLPSENGCDALKGTSLSRGFAPSAGNPFANTVSEREANDQSDCNFKHQPIRALEHDDLGPTGLHEPDRCVLKLENAEQDQD